MYFGLFWNCILVSKLGLNPYKGQIWNATTKLNSLSYFFEIQTKSILSKSNSNSSESNTDSVKAI